MARDPIVGGLHLPTDIGVSESTAQTIENRWNTIDAVNAVLHRQGIHDNIEPDVTCPPVTTEALVTADIKEYTTTFSAQLRWYNYVTRLLADVRAELLQVVNEMADIESNRRTAFRALGGAKKMSAGEMEDRILQDPRYRDLKVERQQREQHKLKLEAWAETLDRNLKTVSRQIENRKTENLGGNREGNMPADANRPGRWQPSTQGPAPAQERGFAPRGG